MGYYTNFTLTCGADGQLAEVIETLETISGYTFECTGDAAVLHAKWYDSVSHMRSLSNTYPHILFTLSGEGEESADMWTDYYLGGKSQECMAKITFDDFDPSKLV